MNFLPIFTKYFSKNTKLLAIVFFVCIPLSISADKYEDEPVIGCDGDVQENNFTTSGARGRDWMDINHDLDNIIIPTRFDAREKWPYCKSIRTILYQGRCGGCWAFASGSVMSDRLCIASDGHFNQFLSIQDILECCIECVTIGDTTRLGGCKGGYLEESFLFWKYKGVVTGGEKGCKPISKGIPFGIATKHCRSKCTTSKHSMPYDYEYDKIFALDAVIKEQSKTNDMRQIQAEIIINGPVAANMDCYKYVLRARGKNVILKYEESKKNQANGAHAIKIIGWDVIDEVPVWIIANSWGRNWCNEGFCYIRRGQNDFGIEVERAIAAGIAIYQEPFRMGGKKGKSTSSSSRITLDRYFLKIVLILNMFLFYQIK